MDYQEKLSITVVISGLSTHRHTHACVAFCVKSQLKTNKMQLKMYLMHVDVSGADALVVKHSIVFAATT